MIGQFNRYGEQIKKSSEAIDGVLSWLKAIGFGNSENDLQSRQEFFEKHWFHEDIEKRGEFIRNSATMFQVPDGVHTFVL